MVALELALYALCLAAAFIVGGVHPPVQVGLAAAGLGLLCASGGLALRDRGLRLPPLAWVMLAAMAWTAFSLVPLPGGALSLLSPQAAALRSELGSPAGPVSLEPAGTALELAKQLAYLCVFLVGTALLRTRQATRRVAVFLALLGLAIAIAITIHRGLHLERFFGLYAPKGHPGSGYFAPFVNGNHAASLLALCALCAFGLAAAAERSGRVLWLVCAAAAAVALLATASRGAAVSLALGGYLLLSIVAGQRFGRLRGLVLSTIVLVVFSAGALVLADGLRTRMFHATTETMVSNQKTRAWRVAVLLGERYPLTGVGRGAFEAPAAALRVEDESIRLNYAEDFVLQVIAEWGWPVALGLLGAALWMLVAAVRRLPVEPELGGLLGGILAVTLHGLVDCGFEIPGVLLPYSLALGAVVARAEADRRVRRRPRRRLGPVALSLSALAGLAIVVSAGRARQHTLEGDVTTLTAKMRAGAAFPAEDVAELLAHHPASAELEMLVGQIALLHHDASALHHLGRAMRLQHSLSRPHELAAYELLRLAKPAQAAIEFRLAGERGVAPSADDLVRFLGRDAVDAVPRTPRDYTRIAMALASAHRWDDADRAFRRALEAGGDLEVRKAKVAAFDQAPVEYRRAMAAELAKEAKTGDEVAAAIRTYVTLGQLDRADELGTDGRLRFPVSAVVVVESARARAARGDLDGARAFLNKASRFDASGRLLLAELAVELAHKAGDLDGAAAAEARLRLLRAKVDLEQPSARTPQ